MRSRSPTDNEIALTLTLSHRNGRGNFSIKEYILTLARFSPRLIRPLADAGEGRVRVRLRPHSNFKGAFSVSRTRPI